ncbi:hypothetical protein [Glaciimonas sp. GG7]
MRNLQRFSISLLSVGLGACAGMVWGQQQTWLLALAVLPAILWIESAHRVPAFLTMLAYFLAASRGLPSGAAVFFGEYASWWLGVFLWLGAALLSSLPWLLFWRTSRKSRALWLPVIFLISVLPPLGFISWTSPLLSASVIFPNFGFSGLLLLVCGFIAWAYRIKTLGLCFVIFSTVAIATEKPLAAPVGWVGINTYYGKLSSDAGAEDSRETFRRINDVRRIAKNQSRGELQLFPETVLGSVDPVLAKVVSEVSVALANRGGSILIGAELPGHEMGSFTNAVMGLGALDGLVVRQRVPVPVAMWRPWQNTGAVADWYGDGVVGVLGYKSAILICYEQLILWPAILSELSQPEIVIGIANNWWASNSSIPAVQAQSLHAISRLFGWKLISSVNL